MYIYIRPPRAEECHQRPACKELVAVLDHLRVRVPSASPGTKDCTPEIYTSEISESQPLRDSSLQSCRAACSLTTAPELES